jgi:hypothetical protein
MIHCIYKTSINKKALEIHTFKGLTVWFQSSDFSARQQKLRFYYTGPPRKKQPADPDYGKRPPASQQAGAFSFSRQIRTPSDTRD